MEIPGDGWGHDKHDKQYKGGGVTPRNVTIDAKCNINPKCNNF